MSTHNVIAEINKRTAVGDTTAVDFGTRSVKADALAESTSGSGVSVADELIKTGGDQTLMIVVADANYTVLAANSGKIHHVANVSADRTFTLPTAAAGLYYEFRSTMEAADGHDWLIVTGSDTNFYKGGLIFHDSDAADGKPMLSAPNGSDDATIQIILPSVGTCVRMYCDGTNWFLSGVVFSVTAPTYT